MLEAPNHDLMIVYQKRSLYNDGDEVPGAAHDHSGKGNDDDNGEGDDGDDEDENDGH